MDATKGNCRNCGSGDVKELGFIGEVAPFFLKRVLNAEIRTSISRHPLRLLARRVCSLPNVLFEKVYGSRAYIEMQICLTCSFIQVKHPFRDEDIGRLYTDYRTQSYNEERIHYEPTYAPFANDVGKAEKEMACRVDGLTTWIQGKIDTGGDFSMLDFGGSDGRFLPRISGKKYVYEISNTQPLPGIARVASEADLGTYSYIQIAHVLEHVTEPLKLLKHVARFMKPNGNLYIEVPQDLPDQDLASLRNGSSRLQGLPVHEHINFYCASSIKRLVEAAGLVPNPGRTTPIDLGWITGTNIRGLCRSQRA